MVFWLKPLYIFLNNGKQAKNSNDAFYANSGGW